VDASLVKKLNNKTELQKWLLKLTTIEINEIEFKKEIPESRNEGEKDGLCKAFSAFSNTARGFIVLGIEDGTKSIIGVDVDSDICRKIADKLSSIAPNVESWELIHTIKLRGTSRAIYFFQVNESPYFQKPHIYKNIIYRRQNGKNEPVKTGLELRMHFGLNDFSPYSFRTMEYIFSKLKKREGLLFAEENYLITLQLHLEERAQNADGNRGLFNELIGLVRTIDLLRQELRMPMAVIGEGAAVPDRDPFSELILKLDELFNKFKITFNL